MKLWIITLLVSVSFLACERPTDEYSDGNIFLFEGDESSDGDTKNSGLTATIVQLNQLFSVSRDTEKDHAQLICRGMAGCLQICQHLKKKEDSQSKNMAKSDDESSEKNCRQSSVQQVRDSWLDAMAHYDDTKALEALNLIATEPAVSAFLKSVDKENTVMQRLFHLSAKAQCPQMEDNEKEIRVKVSSVTPFSVSLLLVSLLDEEARAETQCPKDTSKADEGDTAPIADVTKSTTEADKEAEGVDSSASELVKCPSPAGADEDTLADSATEKSFPKSITVVDGSHSLFNSSIFHSFIKQCFGHQSRTFVEMALDINNKSALELAHRLIVFSCGGDDNCVRLAYCASSDDPALWALLPQEFNELGCSYDSFAREPVTEAVADKSPAETSAMEDSASSSATSTGGGAGDQPPAKGSEDWFEDN